MNARSQRRGWTELGRRFAGEAPTIALLVALPFALPFFWVVAPGEGAPLRAPVVRDAGGVDPATEGQRSPALGFVTAVGSDLVLDGRPFRFVGANLAIMHGPENRAAADEVLRAAAADGIRVARVWAFGEGAPDAAPWLRRHFLFRAGADDWTEEAPRQLDAVIAFASRLGVRLIVTLANQWADYGGIPRYLRWSGQWRDGVYAATDRFYSDAVAQSAYRVHVERLLRRINRVTGIPYREDPTILAWELMNESSADTPAGITARRRFVRTTAQLIHEIDRRHLVMSGVSDYHLRRERDEWLRICALPGVDICDGHLYPEEGLRLRGEAAPHHDDHDPDHDDHDDVAAAVDDFVQLARFVAHKPFVMGELGVHGDASGRWRRRPREEWLAQIFERLRFDGAAGGLVWIYQRHDGADRVHGISIGGKSADRPGVEGEPIVSSPVRRVVREAAAAVVGASARGGGGAPNSAAAAMPPGSVAADGRDAGAAAAPSTNPLLGPARGREPFLPLHAETVGPNPQRALPLPGTEAIRFEWDPVTYARADWESNGIYAGGAWEHAWGRETGWFEFELEIPESSPPRRFRARSLVFRGRVSSEFPGATSPPEGASVFVVRLDGMLVGRAVAPRDDGVGAATSIASSASALLARAVLPGRHVLRIEVEPGPRANGLCLYGHPGAKPSSKKRDTGSVSLYRDARPSSSGKIELIFSPAPR